MGWSRGTHDTWYNVQMDFGRLKDAVAFAETMGWGYDVFHPHHRWHV